MDADTAITLLSLRELSSAGMVIVNIAWTVSLGRMRTEDVWVHARLMLQSDGTEDMSISKSNTSVAPPWLDSPTSNVQVNDGGQLGRIGGGWMTGILSALIRN